MPALMVIRECRRFVGETVNQPCAMAKTMQYLQKFGITIAIEMGPKNVLSNLVTAMPEIEALCFGQKRTGGR